MCVLPNVDLELKLSTPLLGDSARGEEGAPGGGGGRTTPHQPPPGPRLQHAGRRLAPTRLRAGWGGGGLGADTGRRSFQTPPPKLQVYKMVL